MITNKRNNGSNNHNCTPPPIADYSNIRDPLPQPPSGLSWVRNEDTREWTLVESVTIRASVDDIDKGKNNRGRTSSLCSYTSSITDIPECYYNQDQDQCLPQPHPTRRSFANHSTITEHFVETNANSDRRLHFNPSFNSSCSTLGSDDLLSYTMMNVNDCSSTTTTNSNGTAGSNLSFKADEHVMIEHIILPNDTLQGICIQYKVSATRLKQVNQFSGSSLLLAPKCLFIPIKRGKGSNSVDVFDHASSGIKLQDTSTMEYKIHKVLSDCSTLGMREIKAYLELHNWNVDESIEAARADIEWEKCQSGSFDEECKTSIEPPSTSYYKVVNDNINVNVRLTQKKGSGTEATLDANETSTKLLELKERKDAAERWEELSHPSSYKSVIDNSEKLPLFVIGMPIQVEHKKNQTACAEDFQKAPPIDFGIEMKELNSIVPHPAVVTVTR